MPLVHLPLEQRKEQLMQELQVVESMSSWNMCKRITKENIKLTRTFLPTNLCFAKKDCFLFCKLCKRQRLNGSKATREFFSEKTPSNQSYKCRFLFYVVLQKIDFFAKLHCKKASLQNRKKND
jgi:hypothetical protein